MYKDANFWKEKNKTTKAILKLKVLRKSEHNLKLREEEGILTPEELEVIFNLGNG